MANRFWVGGTGDLDGSTTTHISATSGGSGGASYPTSADAFKIDGNSGTGNVNLTVALIEVASIDFTGYTGTFTDNGNAIGTHGNGTLSAGMTLVSTGGIEFLASGTLITNGQIFSAVFSAGGTLTLGDDLSAVILGLGGGGSLNTNGKHVIAGAFIGSGGSGVLTLGASLIEINGTTSTLLNGFDSMTVSAGTSIIKFTASATGTADLGGKTWNSIWVAGPSLTSYLDFVTNGGTIGNLKIDPGNICRFQWGQTFTINSLTALGDVVNFIAMLSTTGGNVWGISKSSGFIFTNYCYIQDSSASGGATFNAAPASFDAGNNTGWNFVNYQLVSVGITSDNSLSTTSNTRKQKALGIVTANSLRIARSIRSTVQAAISEVLSRTANIAYTIHIVSAESVRKLSQVGITTKQSLSNSLSIGRAALTTILIPITYTLGVVKFSYKTIGIILTNSMSVALNKGEALSLYFTNTSSLSILKSALSYLAITSSYSSSLGRSVFSTIHIPIGNTLNVLRIIAYTFGASTANVLTLAKAVLKLIGAAFSNSLSMVRSTLRIIHAVVASSVSLGRTITKTTSISTAYNLSLVKRVNKTVGFVTTQVLTLVNSILKTISMSGAESLSTLKTSYRILSASVASSISIITVRATTKIQNLAFTIGSTLSEAGRVNKTFFMSSANNLKLSRAIRTILHFQNGYALVIARTVKHTLHFISTNTLTAIHKALSLRTFNMVSGNSLRTSKSTLHPISLILAQSIGVGRALGKFTGFTTNYLLSVTSQVTKSFSLVNGQVLSIVKQANKFFSMSNASSISIAFSKQFFLLTDSTRVFTAIKRLRTFFSDRH